MRELGSIVRLQVQRDSIKSGTRPHQQYTPVPNLTPVSKLVLDIHGVHGIEAHGTVVPDVHNATHPHSKYRGDNGISIGFTGHYAAIRARYGDHLHDGIAGENLLVACDEIVPLHTLERGIIIDGHEGEIRIGPWIVAHPCAPFSRFCLELSPEAPSDTRVTETLRFLDNGMRGFTAVYDTDFSPVEIRVGDMVYALE